MTSIGPKAYIHTDRLKQNLWNIRRHIGDRKLVCVVKANGYGHGALEISKVLSKEPGIIFAVFAFEEAIELRDNGIDNEILIFSRIQPELISKASELNFTLNACAMADLKALSDFHVKTGACPTFHLKFDTGMTRLGFDVSEARTVFTFIVDNHLNPEGIYSHFATADEGDLSYAEFQLGQFNAIVEKGKNTGINFKYVHCSNSGAILNLPNAYFNMVRVGILMYGVLPSDEVFMDISVEPVMSFCGPIVNVRKVPAGTQVSYGGVFTTEKETNIAVVQAGFADGFPRPWYEKGFVGYKGQTYKIAGRVCMDQFMVDFGDVEPDPGEEVLFFGKKDGNDIAVETIAKEINTTTYVLLTAIHGRTERIVINN
jgi:alanine racemase